MIEETRVVNPEYKSMWSVDVKYIPIRTVTCQYVFLLYPSEWYGVGYLLWILSNSILVSRKVKNIVGVCYTFIAMDT